MPQESNLGICTISIITVVFNGEKYLEKTIQSVSVIIQDYPKVEFVIIDGGSTDATLDIIRQYESAVDYWVSEPDEGIADAMNKGILNSSGRYLFFLHSDDYLLSNSSLSTVARVISNRSDLYAFPIYYLSGSKLTKRRPRGFNFWLNFKTGLYHQGVFFDRSIFQRIGLYDTSLRIAMDYEFF